MKSRKLLTLLAAAGMASAANGAILLGGYDGTQTQNTIAPANTTSVTGVRELTGGKQDVGAISAVTTRIWTDQTTNKELQWTNVASQSTTTGNWGLTDFTTDASTASTTADLGSRWVISQQAASWINFEISNTGTGVVTLDSFHLAYRRTNISAAPTGAPDTLTISLVDNGTFAASPVLSASDLTAFGTKTLTLTAASTSAWYGAEFAFTDMLSDLTLAAGETATFRIANNLGGNRLYMDNIAISGSIAPVPEPSAALLGGIGLLALLRRRRTA